MPIQINIRVRSLNPPGPTGPHDPEDGTFEEPHPKVKIKQGKDVKFKGQGTVQSFKVTFQGSTPFISSSGAPLFEITDENLHTASEIGTHHYSVSATDGTHTWEISGCPELGVDR